MLKKQVLYNFERPEDKFIAIKFLEYLEPSGWLGKSLDEISLECGISIELAEKNSFETSKNLNLLDYLHVI
ncbi:MAG: hypothetical protein ACJZ8H_03005 [Paracoccaceae bacterium]